MSHRPLHRPLIFGQDAFSALRIELVLGIYQQPDVRWDNPSPHTGSSSLTALPSGI